MRDAWLRSSPLGLGLAGAAALWLAFPNGWISLPPLALLLPLCLALLGSSAPSAGAAAFSAAPSLRGPPLRGRASPAACRVCRARSATLSGAAAF